MFYRIALSGFVSLICLLCTCDHARAQDNTRVSVNFEVSAVSAASKGASPKPSRVVVWLTEPGNHTSSPPTKRFRITQKDKKFHPDFLVVTQGSTVDFPNLDPWFHNVFSQFKGKRFDLGLYQAGAMRSVTFDKAGVSYLFCNIHPEMTAIIVAVDSQYFGVSDQAGHVQISDVPVGKYEVHVWHRDATAESMKAAERTIEVKGDHQPEAIRLTLRPFDPSHKNKYGKDYEGTPLDPQY